MADAAFGGSFGGAQWAGGGQAQGCGGCGGCGGYGADSWAAGGCSQGQPTSQMQGNFSQQEIEHYQGLWRLVDPSNSGYIDGATAANFLGCSGLPQDILHRIWDISDSGGQGALNMERFCIALRLVAHAQAGQAPVLQLASQEPKMLPEFHNLSRQRAPSETSYDVRGSPKRPPSENSDMLPVIYHGAEQEEQPVHAARRQRSRSPSAQRAFTQDRWAPSQRERRKYASLFQRTDWDADGFVLGSEASMLLERSGLDNNALSTCWEHSDRDRDGKLNFLEFVCLVHLVTCALRGARLPSINEPLPDELVNALGRMEPLEVLAAERDASRSRSPSPAASGRASRQHSGNVSPVLPGAEAVGDWGAGGAFGAGAFGEASVLSGYGAGGSGAFGDFSGAGFGDSGKNSDKNKSELGGFSDAGFGKNGFGDDPFGGGFAGEESAASSRKKKSDKRNRSDNDFGTSADFGLSPDEDRRFSDVFNASLRGDGRQYTHDVKEELPRNLHGLKSQFEAVTAADRSLAGQLRTEVDDLHQEMKKLQNEIQQEIQAQKTMEQEMDQHEATEKRPAINAQLLETKGRLAGLREERKTLNAVGASLRQDHGHLTEQSDHLLKLAEDEDRTLEVMRRCSQHLEKSYRSLEMQAEKLQQQCRETYLEFKREQEIKQQEEQQLERLRRDIESRRSPTQASAATFGFAPGGGPASGGRFGTQDSFATSPPLRQGSLESPGQLSAVANRDGV